MIVLSAMNLPVALAGLLISIEPLIDMGRTALFGRRGLYIVVLRQDLCGFRLNILWLKIRPEKQLRIGAILATPRLPRTEISRIRSPLSLSLTTWTSRYSSRDASSGLTPVFAMKST